MTKFRLIPISSLIFMIPSMSLLTACSLISDAKLKSKLREPPKYKIRSGDVIDVKFEYYPDFNRTLIVTSEGTINLQAIGELKVVGLTAEGLELILKKGYSRILAMPTIRVTVRESTSFIVYVSGHITNPGIVKFKSGLTVDQSILLAGGLKSKSIDYVIYILRNLGPEGMKTFKIKLDRKSRHNKVKRNFKLAPYDVVFVMKDPETETPLGKEI